VTVNGEDKGVVSDPYRSPLPLTIAKSEEERARWSTALFSVQ